MTAEQARDRVNRILALSRGTVLQGRLWALLALCESETVFLAALHLSPLLVNLSLKHALAHDRRRILPADIQSAKKAQAERWQKKYVQYQLFSKG